MGPPSETSEKGGADGQINAALPGNPSWRRCTVIVWLFNAKQCQGGKTKTFQPATETQSFVLFLLKLSRKEESSSKVKPRHLYRHLLVGCTKFGNTGIVESATLVMFLGFLRLSLIVLKSFLGTRKVAAARLARLKTASIQCLYPLPAAVLSFIQQETRSEVPNPRLVSQPSGSIHIFVGREVVETSQVAEHYCYRPKTQSGFKHRRRFKI